MAEEKDAPKPADQAPKDVMGMLEYYLVKKAPYQIPENAKKWIVQWGPWIELVLLILALPVLLLALGISAAFVPFASAGVAGGFSLVVIILVVQLGLEVAALPGLFARKRQGWTLAFYAQILSFVTSLFGRNIIGALLSLVVGLYVLFQIRSYYK